VRSAVEYSDSCRTGGQSALREADLRLEEAVAHMVERVAHSEDVGVMAVALVSSMDSRGIVLTAGGFLRRAAMRSSANWRSVQRDLRLSRSRIRKDLL
jgi:hypothetical protein